MPTPFASFFAGGFESAAHRRPDRLRVDVIRGTRHDLYAETDYRLLQQAGIFTVRDALRWHLIEQQPGIYDWSSLLPLLQASVATGTQVIWDLCHWGIPDDVDIFSPHFVDRFIAFARSAALLIAEHTTVAPLLCPINEISFWSWIGADIGSFYPYANGAADTLKRQLVRASRGAIEAIRAELPGARFVQAEPLIHIAGDSREPLDQIDARRHTEAQFETWDWLADAHALDIIGVNYYWNNQWMHEGERTPPGHPLHKPLHQLLLDVWRRYGKPLYVSETGAEGPVEAGWIAYICAEVREAQRHGAEILGICLYPVADYPGWDDDRHCACGLIEIDSHWQQRTLREHLVAELHVQKMFFAGA